jgi:hypothetical protein
MRDARFDDPAVYEVLVEAVDVLTYIGEEEHEYLVLLPRRTRPARIEGSSATHGET